MIPVILGSAWITPLGRGRESVWAQILDGATSSEKRVGGPEAETVHPAYLVDPSEFDTTSGIRRLRRSSTISLLAVAAATDALSQIGHSVDPLRTALVFAASDGGVIYTRRFFAELAERGAGAGSPILFPETVYNAPVSHVAACLGIEGTATAIVGDASAGMTAISLATDLLTAGECDRAVVVAAEEIDWIICEAYARWNMTATSAPIEPFSSRGTIFSEAAAAIVLGMEGDGATVEVKTSGLSRSPRAAHRKLLQELVDEDDQPFVIASANGTRLDSVERSAFQILPAASRIVFPKRSLGEAFAASTLIQVICATIASQESPGKSVTVSSVGTSGQSAVATICTRG